MATEAMSIGHTCGLWSVVLFCETHLYQLFFLPGR